MLRTGSACFIAMTEAFRVTTQWHGAIPREAFAIIMQGTRVLLRESSLAQEVGDSLADRLPKYSDMVWHIDAEAEWHFMGQFSGEWGDTPVMAWSLSIAPDGFVWVDVRSLLASLTPAGYDLLGRSMQVLEWADKHRFCGRCGGPMQAHSRGERARARRPPRGLPHALAALSGRSARGRCSARCCWCGSPARCRPSRGCRPRSPRRCGSPRRSAPRRSRRGRTTRR